MTDIEIIPLQIMYKEDGKPIDSGADILMGEYDIDKGLLFKFYMKNLNANLRANISKLKSANDNSVFVGPESGFIGPNESVQVLFRISPIDNIEKLGVEPLKSPQFPKDSDKIIGTVRWENASNV